MPKYKSVDLSNGFNAELIQYDGLRYLAIAKGSHVLLILRDEEIDRLKTLILDESGKD